MSQSEDRNFIRQFSGIIIGLVLLTITLIFLARSLQFEPEVDVNPSQKVLSEQRISPVSSVRIGDEGAAALAEEQAVAAPEQSVIVEVDGEGVYNGLCMTCHAAGVAEAPIPGSEQMSQRAEKGMDALMQTALNGLNAMPARGGRPDLSDEQVQAIVEFMTK
jgi:cytochrome c5